MSFLGEENLIRSCQFDATDGVSAFHLDDSSVQEYSRATHDRANKAQQLVEQKGADDEGHNKENIEATISEDLADGQVSKLDACLNLLGEDDPHLYLPSDFLDEDELHFIETEFAPQNLATGTDGGNHALQDYQMQLMLLEQQNKKRLLRARQEQDNYSAPQNRRGSPPRNFFSAGAGTKKALYEAIARQRKNYTVAGKGTTAQTTTPLYPFLKMPRSLAAGDATPAPKRQKRAQKASSSILEIPTNGDATATSSTDSSPPEMPPADRLPPNFALLYKIACKTSYTNSHPVPAYCDVPVPDVGSQGHLNGRAPVYDLQTFMEDEKDDIAYVIIRTIECSEASVLMARSGVPLRYTESIYAKSADAKKTLHHIATCYFHEASPGPTPAPHPWETAKSDDAAYDQNRIDFASLFLFHHRVALQKWAAQQTDSKHTDALLEYISNRYGAEFANADSLFAQGLVTQAHIAKLFKPNELVVGGTHGKLSAFVVQDWPVVTSEGWMTLNCWSLQTDGSGYARKCNTLMVSPVERQVKDIKSLLAYPLSFATPETRESIRKRGEKLWALRTATQITYKGWNVGRDQFFSDARFMIDYTVYHKMHPYARAFTFQKPSTTRPFDRMPAYLSADQKPSDVDLLLLQPDMHGFYLNEKKWLHLFVDNVRPVSWNKQAFERLVLPDQTKDLVRALVTVRMSQRGVKQGLGIAGKRTDIAYGKGNGLIMLLHGGPGTGKTLTAESVAEIAEMPLYRVTCGDIGTNAEAVEKYLNTVLHLGKTWNCVLLLDEADVFLEERSMADLKRNSLVSVFLRILEYYDGILILTSNRVGMFDEAFKSRIQVALHYENLNRSTRKKIWQNFLDMLEEDEENVNFDEIKYHLDDLAGRELNGRQIRNVLTTARQLAIFRDERLDWKHLEQALAVSSDFNDYLKRMQGHSDDQRARDTGLR